MKSTEFRIGNYLQSADSGGYLNQSTEFIIKNGKCIDMCFIEGALKHGISPIPLTEERLIKLGATKLPTKSGFVASYKLGSLTINKSAIGNYYYRKNVYNNVHQIQNLYFAVEQEELTI